MEAPALPTTSKLTFFLLIIPVPALLMTFFSALVLLVLPAVPGLGIPALSQKRSASKMDTFCLGPGLMSNDKMRRKTSDDQLKRFHQK